MAESRRGAISPGCAAAILCGLLLAVIGCQPPAEAPTPPRGGREFTLNFDEFSARIDPILHRRGCDADGDCHGGGIRGTFRLTREEERDPALDFEEVRLQVWPEHPERSPILVKPLAVAAGGERHSFEPFRTADDPDYRAILEWIDAGVFE